MKTASYPNLPILQNCKVFIKCSMKFPSVIDEFSTPFSLKPIYDKIEFQAIVVDLYKCLTIDDLLKMKINKQSYLEVK